MDRPITNHYRMHNQNNLFLLAHPLPSAKATAQEAHQPPSSPPSTTPQGKLPKIARSTLAQVQARHAPPMETSFLPNSQVYASLLNIQQKNARFDILLHSELREPRRQDEGLGMRCCCVPAVDSLAGRMRSCALTRTESAFCEVLDWRWGGCKSWSQQSPMNNLASTKSIITRY